ncbi:Undecaprenyl-phosphate 4-deoxy-4-formamido-L-arabinose transferase [Yersinia ruckeri ATCC 29473]|nr:Undecaprenyl-phosphate 4-deoxy-4-formamido-L-arabinose transferase [Yersinia ruckeri ATCC 29473]
MIKKVSIVIPVYNEQESLPTLLERTKAACQKLSQPYEIIMVDDGSSDNSAAMLTAAAEQPGSAVIAVLLNRNYGQHSAIMAGFNQVSGDLVITLDADLQNPPEEIPHLVSVAEEGYDVVGTVRANRQDSLFRKTASKLINMMSKKPPASPWAITVVCCGLIDGILLMQCYTVTSVVHLFLFWRIPLLAVPLKLQYITPSENLVIPNTA